MAKAYSKALKKSIELKRILGKVRGDEDGPTIIFIAGMHGNEPSGVFALKEVFDSIEERKLPIRGTCYAIVGNIKALDKGIRFLDEDLNRIWDTRRMEALLSGKSGKITKETPEQLEIYELLRTILDTENGPFYFIDLHTTSSKTIPFTLVNDTLLNRRFVSQYPVPMILGIEEYLEGPLLSYINELGYVAFGYESGEHDELRSIEYHVAFIYLTLAFTGCIDKSTIDFDRYYQLLANTSNHTKDTYEIFATHKILGNEDFKMNPGFDNFQHVRKNQALATSNQKTIVAIDTGRIFMPLYQCHGDDGFFIIRRIPKFFLNLSAVLRKVKFDRLLPLLPGISVHPDRRETLLVNRKVARFFAKQFFHLLGYRSRQLDPTHLIIKNRETHSRRKEYIGAGAWVDRNN
ncbi:aspartoacylase [Flavobacteriaceae bacterium TP-CH-4]|uniref:Aspartoacylase n=1 Tax=Pelagihabitans pacificus TaxID=2696054 RepID=A0A967AQM7_9FLAO|nr:succinylglutamate desuccinylase/aspartoacylase family protein [Pelagihabitans pacificus]NHF57740.1 aspartoacylase [Pelagihabitans pacificus]